MVRATEVTGIPTTSPRSDSTRFRARCRVTPFGVELDAFETHRTRDAFERDHERDLDFALAEIETRRVSEQQFRREPAVIVARVAQLLLRRPQGPG